MKYNKFKKNRVYVFSKKKYLKDIKSLGEFELLDNLNDSWIDKIDGKVVQKILDGDIGICNGFFVSIDWCKRKWWLV